MRMVNAHKYFHPFRKTSQEIVPVIGDRKAYLEYSKSRPKNIKLKLRRIKTAEELRGLKFTQVIILGYLTPEDLELVLYVTELKGGY